MAKKEMYPGFGSQGKFIKKVSIYPCIDPVGIEIRHHEGFLLDVEDAVSVVIVLGKEHLDLHVREVAPAQESSVKALIR